MDGSTASVQEWALKRKHVRRIPPTAPVWLRPFPPDIGWWQIGPSCEDCTHSQHLLTGTRLYASGLCRLGGGCCTCLLVPSFFHLSSLHLSSVIFHGQRGRLQKYPSWSCPNKPPSRMTWRQQQPIILDNVSGGLRLIVVVQHVMLSELLPPFCLFFFFYSWGHVHVESVKATAQQCCWSSHRYIHDGQEETGEERWVRTTRSLLKSRVQNDDPADASLEASFQWKVDLLSVTEEGEKKIVEK